MKAPYEHTYTFSLTLSVYGTMREGSTFRFRKAIRERIEDMRIALEDSIPGHVTSFQGHCNYHFERPPKMVQTTAITPQWPPAMDVMP